MDRRVYNETRRDDLEMQCFNMSYERWEAIYKGSLNSIIDPPSAENMDVPVNDIDLINRWYEERENSRAMSGAGEVRMPAEPLWGEWK